MSLYSTEPDECYGQQTNINSLPFYGWTGEYSVDKNGTLLVFIMLNVLTCIVPII